MPWKVPRFRIASFMVVVAVVALDFSMIRAMPVIGPPTSVLLVIGALPMANVLPVILLIGHRRPEDPSIPPGICVVRCDGVSPLCRHYRDVQPLSRLCVFSVTPVSVYLVRIIGSHRPLLFSPQPMTFALVCSYWSCLKWSSL